MRRASRIARSMTTFTRWLVGRSRSSVYGVPTPALRSISPTMVSGDVLWYISTREIIVSLS